MTTTTTSNQRQRQQQHHHHQQHRPVSLSVSPPSISRFHPSSSPASPFFLFSPSSVSTPSKLRRHHYYSSKPSSAAAAASSYSSILVLLFSLRSLYSLLPFFRSSSPSSIFPFSFLVSLLSFLLITLLSLPSLFPLPSLRPHLSSLFLNSSLVSLSLILRFLSLRSCGTAATILADLSGSLLASSLQQRPQKGRRFLIGLLSLFLAHLALSYSWHRIGCSPLSSSDAEFDRSSSCSRLIPMLLPFLSGFLAHYERASASWGSLRQLGRKRARSLSLALSTLILFFPALLTVMFSDTTETSVASVVWSGLGWGWPLINAVIFGVLLNDNHFSSGSSSDKAAAANKNFRREFGVIFICTLLLEMFYFPKISLPGFLFCGFLLWVSFRELAPASSPDNLELGAASGDGDTSAVSLYSMVMNPVCHILSERKSRKIAVFLLINAVYMVVEFVAGFMSNSLGLISDACHMLFDCAALAIGLYASYISRLPADHQYNYGRGRTEVLSGYVNAVFLVLVGALIVLESIERILDPQEISTNSLLIVSIGGFLVNVVGLIFFHEEHHHAHGGGGTCSHSHPHSHSNLHDHCHHAPDNSTDHDHGANTGHHNCVEEISHDSLNGHSHGDANHDCLYHQQDTDKVSISESNYGKYKSQNHDHHCHDHGDNIGHCHEKEHDHRDHTQKDEVHIHQNPIKLRHELQRRNTSSANSHGDCHEGLDNTHCHDDKNNGKNMQEHSHVHSTLSVETSAQKDPHKHTHCHSDKENCSHTQDHLLVNSSLSMNSSTQKDSHKHNHCHGYSEDSCHMSDNLHVQSPLSMKSSTHKDSHKHHHIDHNMEGIFLHVLADTMGSVGVVISTLLIKYKGWLVADPACSIFISVMIVASVIPLLRNSAEFLLQRIPRAHEQDLRAAIGELKRIKGVCGVQKLHVWNFTNTDIVGTLHLQVSAETDKAPLRNRASDLLHEAGVKDITIQVECVRG